MFKFKLKATFHMKSGDRITIKCDKINIKSNDNDLTQYEVVGKNTGSLMYVRIDDVSAITYTRCLF